MKLPLSIGLAMLSLCAGWSLSTAQTLYAGEAYANVRYYSSKGLWPDSHELDFYFNNKTTRIDPTVLPAATDTFSITCNIFLLTDSFVIDGSSFRGRPMQDSQYFAVNNSHYLEIQKVNKDSLICLFRRGSYSQTLEPKDGGGHEFVQHWILTIGRYVMHAESSAVRLSKEAGLVCYPNPANDMLTICGLQGDPVAITLYTLNGCLVLSESTQPIDTTHTIDISRLSPGMYVAFISGPDGINALSFCKR